MLCLFWVIIRFLFMDKHLLLWRGASVPYRSGSLVDLLYFCDFFSRFISLISTQIHHSELEFAPHNNFWLFGACGCICQALNNPFDALCATGCLHRVSCLSVWAIWMLGGWNIWMSLGEDYVVWGRDYIMKDCIYTIFLEQLVLWACLVPNWPNLTHQGLPGHRKMVWSNMNTPT